MLHNRYDWITLISKHGPLMTEFKMYGGRVNSEIGIGGKSNQQSWTSVLAKFKSNVFTFKVVIRTTCPANNISITDVHNRSFYVNNISKWTSHDRFYPQGAL